MNWLKAESSGPVGLKAEGSKLKAQG